MKSFYLAILLYLFTHVAFAGPFAHYLNPITKQANRIDFGSKTIQFLIDGKHWVNQGSIQIDSLSLSEIRKDAEFKTLPTNTSNQYILFQECTNQIFSFDLAARTLIRLDRTYYRGDNCGSIVFTRQNKYYQIGGYGFWKGNNHITFYDPNIKEWEGIPVSGEVPRSIYRGYTAYLPKEDKIFTFSNFSNDISHDLGSLTLSTDIHEFSFTTKKWSKIGEITHPHLRDLLSKIPIDRRIQVIFTGTYFALFPIGTNGHVTIIFIDPRNLGIYEYQDTDMKFARFPFFDQSSANPNSFISGAYILGTKHSNASHLVNSSQLINLNDVARKAVFIGYLTDKPWYLNYWIIFPIGIFSIGFIFYLFRFGQGKKDKVIPNEPTQLNVTSGYFDDLQVRLLMHFYQHSTSEGLDVEQVNEILGIHQLGPDTQRFRRSAMIKDLNTKLAMLTGEKNAILRVNSPLDKRQKRYQLHEHVKDFVKKELAL
jgi:hypothetical protein